MLQLQGRLRASRHLPIINTTDRLIKNCFSARKPTIDITVFTVDKNPVDACAGQRAGDVGAGESLPKAERGAPRGSGEGVFEGATLEHFSRTCMYLFVCILSWFGF